MAVNGNSARKQTQGGNEHFSIAKKICVAYNTCKRGDIKACLSDRERCEMSKLSFKAFCIEYYAEHTKQSSAKIYEIFKDTGLLDLLDCDYGDLHGMGMEYLMQFFDAYLGREKEYDPVSRDNA